MGQNNTSVNVANRFSVQRANQQLGLTIVRDTNSSQEFLMQDLHFSNNFQKQQLKKTLENHLKLNNQNLLCLVQIIDNSQKTICSQIHKLTLIYQYASHSLHQEISIRFRQNKPFQQKQLLSIMCSVTLAMSYLQRQGITHNNICSQTIFVTQEGLIKVGQPQASKAFASLAQYYPFAPQIKNKSFSNIRSIFKADVYSLGITMLCASLLQPYQGLYQNNQPIISQIDLLLNQCKSRFGIQWTKIISLCLKPFQIRPDFIQLQSQLQDLIQQQQSQASRIMKQPFIKPKLSIQGKTLINNIFGQTPKQNTLNQNLNQRSKSQRKGLDLTSKKLQANKAIELRKQFTLEKYKKNDTTFPKQRKLNPPNVDSSKIQQLKGQLSNPFDQIYNKQFFQLQNKSGIQMTKDINPKNIVYREAQIIQPKLIKHFKISQGVSDKFKESIATGIFQQTKLIPQVNKISQQYKLKPIDNFPSNYDKYRVNQQFKILPQLNNYSQFNLQHNNSLNVLRLGEIKNQIESIQQPNLNKYNYKPIVNIQKDQIYKNLQLTNKISQKKQDHLLFRNQKETIQIQMIKKIPYPPLKPITSIVQKILQPKRPQSIIAQPILPFLGNQNFPIQNKNSLKPQYSFANPTYMKFQQNRLNLAPFIVNQKLQPLNLNRPATEYVARQVKQHKLYPQKLFTQGNSFDTLIQVKHNYMEKKPTHQFTYNIQNLQRNHQVQHKYQNLRIGPIIQIKNKQNVLGGMGQVGIYAQSRYQNSKKMSPFHNIHSQFLNKGQISDFKPNQIMARHQTLANLNFSNNIQKKQIKINDSLRLPTFLESDSIKQGYFQRTLRQADILMSDHFDLPNLTNGPQFIQGAQDPLIDQVQENQVDHQQQSNIQFLDAHAGSQTTIYVVQVYNQGARYQGWKVAGQRQGHGKFYYQDGGLYCGMWKKNKMHGQGTLYYCNGKPAYDGQWQFDKFNGSGTLYNQQPQISNKQFDYRDFNLIGNLWQKYSGDFIQDSKQGWGKLTLTNGQQFQGQFKEDDINGKGLYKTKDGRKIQGHWRNNILV